MISLAYNIGSTVAIGFLIDHIISLLTEKPEHVNDFFPITVVVGTSEFLLRSDDFKADYLFEKIATETNKKQIDHICFFSKSSTNF